MLLHMERRKEEKLDAILLRFLRQAQLEGPLNEFRLIEAWGEVAGPVVERSTKDLKIYNQTLYVSIRSAAMRTELMMRRSELVQALNKRVGAQVIVDICFS